MILKPLRIRKVEHRLINQQSNSFITLIPNSIWRMSDEAAPAVEITQLVVGQLNGNLFGHDFLSGAGIYTFYHYSGNNVSGSSPSSPFEISVSVQVRAT